MSVTTEERNREIALLLGIKLVPETDDEIAQRLKSCVQSMNSRRTKLWWIRDSRNQFAEIKTPKGARWKSDAALWAWKNRAGQPWQDAFEKLVTTEDTPPRYSEDLLVAYTLGDACSERYCWVDYMEELGNLIMQQSEEMDYREFRFAICHATAEQRAQAACIALTQANRRRKEAESVKPQSVNKPFRYRMEPQPKADGGVKPVRSLIRSYPHSWHISRDVMQAPDELPEGKPVFEDGVWYWDDGKADRA